LCKKMLRCLPHNIVTIISLLLFLNCISLWSKPQTSTGSEHTKRATLEAVEKTGRLEMANQKLFVEKLNKALENEYAAVVQYVQHAAVITGAQYDAIAKELVVHANEELDHAVKISELINDFDGVPTINVEKREISNDGKKMLEQDLAGEQVAIDGYKELVKIANELGEFGAAQVLEGILAKEEEHKRDLLGALGH